jgi:hypothetical protein
MTIVRYFAPGAVERHDMDVLPKLLTREVVTAGMLAWTKRLGWW